MPKKKRPDEKPEEQFKRFVETARERGVDEDGKVVEAAFKRISRKPCITSPVGGVAKKESA